MRYKINQHIRYQYLLTVILFLFFAKNVISQISLGQWRDHLPYSYAKCLSYNGNMVYVGTNHSAFSFNTQNKQQVKLGKVQGFTDLDVQGILYHKFSDQLVIVYKNGNIDLYRNEIVTNISDIVSKPEITYKTVNDIGQTETDLWLACSFGIIKFNLSRNEISDTYYIGGTTNSKSVDKILLSDGKVFILSDAQIQTAEANNPLLNNPVAWTSVVLPAGYNPTSITQTTNNLQVCVQWNTQNAILLLRKSDMAEIARIAMPDNNYIIKTQGDDTYILREGSITKYNEKGEQIEQINNYSFGNMMPTDIIWQEESNKYYVTDKQYGLVVIDGSEMSYHYPNGPLNHHCFKLATLNGIVYATGGAVDLAWSPLFFNPELYRFRNEVWDSYIDFNGKAHDFIDLAIDPRDANRVLIASWSEGVAEWNNGLFKTYYTDINSTLRNISPYNSGHIRIGGLAFDYKNRLWANNSGTSAPLHMLDTEGDWYQMSDKTNLNVPTIGKLIVTSDNTKWCILPRGNGLLAYTDKETPEINSDDNWKKISLINRAGSLITNQIFDFVQDQNGTMWLGTDKGVLLIYAPSEVFRQTLITDEITVLEEENDSVAQILLANESVTAIATDGANRKWLGTSNSGVFLVSENGTKTLAHFTAENSPLLSNTILDIAINGITGEVFFATENGLISYKGSSTTGSNSFAGMYVYPNPVRPGYSGSIVIAGLVNNAEVYITDVTGNTVFRTTALGGQAIWEGNNGANGPVASGVYLIFCTSPEGELSASTKLLIIRD